MGIRIVLYLQFLILIRFIVETSGKSTDNITFIPAQPYNSDFNFHNKSAFLKGHIKKLVECIQPSNKSSILKQSETLRKSSEGSRNGQERFVFEFTGTRLYNESCLGDTYRRNFIKRLYDAVCVKYEEKVQFLDLFSCNATQNLECRQVGVEKERSYAEQATPIMRCLCPDYNKSQAYLSDKRKGYFDLGRQQCVLKEGNICEIKPKSLDARLVWNDFDFGGGNDTEGIDVVELRPMSMTYPCVNHSFCYIKDNNRGLDLPTTDRSRCVCEAGYFVGADRECHAGREPPTTYGLFLSAFMFSIALFTFLAAILI